MKPQHHAMSHDQRQKAARIEFAHWREANPNFTTRELLDAWARIRRAWGLSAPPQRKTP